MREHASSLIAKVGDGWPRQIRVASVPASHVYVRHLSPLDSRRDRVFRLPDPDPADPRRPATATWWPPIALDAEWAAANQASFDVFHVHFGFDACSTRDLTDLVSTLRRHHKPLVYTVHDLRNPHHLDRGDHDQHLDVLIPAADAVITLTSGAAREIHERWGTSVSVLPHPHVVDLETMARMTRRPHSDHASFRVGVHLKSLRPSMDPLPVLEVLRQEVKAMPGAVLQVNGHRDILVPGGSRYDAGLADTLSRWTRGGEIELLVHDFYSDDELWDYLKALDASVLPYRFGTHSGWLEACRDLGTMVLAPTCGFYADQGPVISYHHDEAGLDPASLVTAIWTAYEKRPSFSITIEERYAERNAIARAHEDLYRRILS